MAMGQPGGGWGYNCGWHGGNNNITHQQQQLRKQFPRMSTVRQRPLAAVNCSAKIILSTAAALPVKSHANQ
jgi:hypothetical protein